MSRLCGGGVPGVPGGGPHRAPLFCEGHICGRGVPNSGNSKGELREGEKPLPYPPTPSPESAPNPHTPVRRGLLLPQFGAQRYPPTRLKVRT